MRLCGKEHHGQAECLGTLMLRMEPKSAPDFFVCLFCLCCFPSWQTGNSEVGVHLAPELRPVLHRPQLQQAPLGEVVYGDLRFVHAVDRSLLLHDGVDGESRTPGCWVPPERSTLNQRGARAEVLDQSAYQPAVAAQHCVTTSPRFCGLASEELILLLTCRQGDCG